MYAASCHLAVKERGRSKRKPATDKELVKEERVLAPLGRLFRESRGEEALGQDEWRHLPFTGKGFKNSAKEGDALVAG